MRACDDHCKGCPSCWPMDSVIPRESLAERLAKKIDLGGCVCDEYGGPSEGLVCAAHEDIRDAITAALDAAKRAVCRGCDAEWPIDADPTLAPDVLHVIPVELREPPTEYARGTHYACDAAAIEALKEMR